MGVVGGQVRQKSVVTLVPVRYAGKQMPTSHGRPLNRQRRNREKKMPVRVWPLPARALFWIALVGVPTGIAYLGLVPSISADPESPLNADPFATPFDVQNKSLFSIFDVSSYCTIESLIDHRRQNQVINVESFNSAQTAVEELEPGKKSAVQCFRPIDESLFTPAAETATILISVRYAPKFALGWHMTNNFRFVTALQSDGQLRWVPLGRSSARLRE